MADQISCGVAPNAGWAVRVVAFEMLCAQFVLLKMLSVVLLGTGNVAQHLFQALKKVDSVLVIERPWAAPDEGMVRFGSISECD